MTTIWEFRVEYLRDGEVKSRYHYFNAFNYKQALYYHEEVISRHGNGVKVIKIERQCPYRLSWITEDEDELFTNSK